MILNAGCGFDKRGDVRVDIDPKVKPDLVADIQYLPFRYKMFQDIWILHVLEHVYSAMLCLLELKKHFKGRLFIIVPHVYYYIRILRTIKRGIRIPIPPTSHLQVWDIITMKQLMLHTGLEIVDSRFSIFDKDLWIVARALHKRIPVDAKI